MIPSSPQPDGRLLLGNRYLITFVDDSWTPLRRINADGSPDTSFQLDPQIKNETFTSEAIAAANAVLGIQKDGRILFGYLALSGDYRLMRLNANGSLDTSFQRTSVPATGLRQMTVYTPGPQLYGDTAQSLSFIDAQILPDGKIVVVGSFRTFNAKPAHGIIRLNPDGKVDSEFNPGGGAQWVETSDNSTGTSPHPQIDNVELQANGDLLIAGTFEAFDGTAAPGIASLHPDGSVDQSFVAPVLRDRLGIGREGNHYTSVVTPFTATVLEKQADGSFLLSGPYRVPGSTQDPSFIRLLGPPPGVVNISTRLAVGTGDDVLIAGFIITGQAPKTVIIRGIGPSIEVNGTPLPGTLQDPTLKLYAADGTQLNANDDWRSSQEQEITATGLQPSDNRESTLLVTLPPGSYTAALAGKNDATGLGVLEAYDLTGAADPALASKLANISARGFCQHRRRCIDCWLYCFGCRPRSFARDRAGTHRPGRGRRVAGHDAGCV